MERITYNAFNGDATLKEKLLEQLRLHKEQDQLVQGSYGDSTGKKFKGCAVGCGIHSLNLINGTNLSCNDHEAYADAIGIDVRLMYLQDLYFERLHGDLSQNWPLRFIEAIPVGADTFLVWPKHAVHILGQPPQSDHTQTVIGLYKRVIAGGIVTKKEWLDAAYAYADADADADAAHIAHIAYAADVAYVAHAAHIAHIAYADKLIQLLQESK